MKHFTSLRTLLVILVIAAIAPLFVFCLLKSVLISDEAIADVSETLQLIASTVALAQDRVVDSDENFASALRNVLEMGGLPAGASLTVMDRDGVVLSGSAEKSTPVGQFVSSPLLQQAVKSVTTGLVQGPDINGVHKIYAVALTGATGNHAFFVAVGLNLEAVLQPARRSLTLELTALIVATGFGCLLAWAVGGRAIIRPAIKLLRAAQAFQAGRLDVRIPMAPDGVDHELALIATGFNQMAHTIQQRETDLTLALQRSEQAKGALAVIVNSLQDGLIAVDAEARIFLRNPAASRVFTADPANRPMTAAWLQQHGLFVPGTNDLYALDDFPLYKALRGNSGGPQLIHVKNDGVPEGRLISARYRPITDDQGRAGGLMVFSDITELEELQQERADNDQALRESQSHLLDAQRLGRIGHWHTNPVSLLATWSPQVFDIFGMTPGSFDGRPTSFVRRVHPEDRDLYAQHHASALHAQTELDIEYRIITPVGDTRWVHQLGQVRLNNDGQAYFHAGTLQDITTRKQAVLDLARSLDLLQRTGKMAAIGGWEVSFSPLAAQWTDELYRIHELEPGEALTARKVLRFFTPEAQPRLRKAIRAALAQGTLWDMELPLRTAKGRLLWVRAQGQPLHRDGQLVGLSGALQDITQRKWAEQAMRDGEQRYAALFEQVPVPMWVYDAETFEFLTVNSAAARDYGYSVKEFLSMSIHDIRCDAETQRLTTYPSSMPYDRQDLLQHRRKDGSLLTVRAFFKAIQYAGKAAWFVLPLDVSAQLQAENKVIDYLATLERAATAAQNIILHLSVDRLMDEVALQARSVIGAHQAVVTTCPDADWSAATHVSSFSKKYTDVISSGPGAASPPGQLLAMVDTDVFASTCRSNQVMRLTQDELAAHPGGLGIAGLTGQQPAMRGWLAVPLVGRQGKTMGLLQLSDKCEGEFTLQDEYVATELARLASIAMENAGLLDEVKQLNADLEQQVIDRTAALTRQEALFRVLAENAPQIVWTVDNQGGATYLNRAWFDVVGGDMQDWAGVKWLAAIHPDDVSAFQAEWALAKASKTPCAGTRRLRTQEGHFRTMAYRATPVFAADGMVDFWIGIDTDVTEIKATEAALRLSIQEMETFSYSVSHDLRSPLNTIDGFSRLLSRQLGEQVGDKERHFLSRIQAGVAQMGQLIEDLLSLAHVSRLQVHNEHVDLSAVAQRIVQELRSREPERAVAVDVQTDLHAVGDAGLLYIVLDNLLRNAWKFTAGTPHAAISVGQDQAASGQRVFFVRDNGAGFDMAFADKLFVAFQRLHAPSEFSGTGIGLATAHRAIGRHNGRLWAEAAVNKGATFFFTLG